MPLTQDFRETIWTRVQRDPTFREELFREGVECLLAGDMATGKAVLRDDINATIGFEKLGILTEKSAKSLMRMFSPTGNRNGRDYHPAKRAARNCEDHLLEEIECACAERILWATARDGSRRLRFKCLLLF